MLDLMGRTAITNDTSVFFCQTGIIRAGQEFYQRGELHVDDRNLSEELAEAINGLKVYHQGNGGFAGRITVFVEAFGEVLPDAEEEKEDQENAVGV